MHRRLLRLARAGTGNGMRQLCFGSVGRWLWLTGHASRGRTARWAGNTDGRIWGDVEELIAVRAAEMQAFLRRFDQRESAAVGGGSDRTEWSCRAL